MRYYPAKAYSPISYSLVTYKVGLFMPTHFGFHNSPTRGAQQGRLSL
jgi:hypothetical protein